MVVRRRSESLAVLTKGHSRLTLWHSLACFRLDISVTELTQVTHEEVEKAPELGGAEGPGPPGLKEDMDSWLEKQVPTDTVTTCCVTAKGDSSKPQRTKFKFAILAKAIKTNSSEGKRM